MKKYRNFLDYFCFSILFVIFSCNREELSEIDIVDDELHSNESNITRSSSLLYISCDSYGVDVSWDPSIRPYLVNITYPGGSHLYYESFEQTSVNTPYIPTGTTVNVSITDGNGQVRSGTCKVGGESGSLEPIPNIDAIISADHDGVYFDMNWENNTNSSGAYCTNKLFFRVTNRNYENGMNFYEVKTDSCSCFDEQKFVSISRGYYNDKVSIHISTNKEYLQGACPTGAVAWYLTVPTIIYSESISWSEHSCNWGLVLP